MKKILIFILTVLTMCGCASKENNLNSVIETTEKLNNVSDVIEPIKINKESEVTMNLNNKTIKQNEKIIDKEYENITLSFVGDMYLSDTLYEHYTQANNSISSFMDEKIINNFISSDIMIANHEYASTDLPDSEKDTRQKYNFKAPTNREILWNELGVDVVSLANNHIMDYGVQSLYDTIETLNSVNISSIGAGPNLEEAKKAYITEIQGKKIAILATCRFVVDTQWYATNDSPGVLTTYDTTPYFKIIKEEITRLKEEEKCDFVAIYVHFGTEKQNTPNNNQSIIAHGYIDAGADLVIGSHAHTLQGIEFYNGKPIYYNLGNFLFSSYQVDTMIVNISINEDNSCTTSIVPCIAKNYKVESAQEEEYNRILNYIESISINASIDEYGNVVEKDK